MLLGAWWSCSLHTNCMRVAGPAKRVAQRIAGGIRFCAVLGEEFHSGAGRNGGGSGIRLPMGMNVRFPAANPCPSEDRCGLVHAFGILAAISDQRSAIVRGLRRTAFGQLRPVVHCARTTARTAASDRDDRFGTPLMRSLHQRDCPQSVPRGRLIVGIAPRFSRSAQHDLKSRPPASNVLRRLPRRRPWQESKQSWWRWD